MLTRALFLSAGWFVISLVATLVWGARLRKSNILTSLGWLTAVLLLGDLWAILTFGVPQEMAALTAVTFLFGLLWIVWFRDWNALGQVCWTITLTTTLLFVAYAFMVTAFSPLNPFSFITATIFFFVEAAALLLALTHTYESLDVICRIRWRRRLDEIPEKPGYAPKVSLHVPTYNEPPEVVERTLRSLARLDYPDYEVLVVDNNTPEEETWRPLEKVCRELGPHFRCVHLHDWPGYKSGALNFALAQTAPDAEIIGTIDADYRLDPSFLRDLVPAFADPDVAFIQTPQDYADYEGHLYTEAVYYSYKYFFEVSMPSRNEHNAIIFAGTMGLIRKSVLQEIGGWDEWCITEDAEASLRILKRGYKSLYLKRTYGRGLMPFTFEGLKKQRFRWCFGGIQILKKHWEALMPWARWVDPDNQLTLAQRYYYLAGGLQWFTDVFNLIFALFLVLGGLLSIVTGTFAIRPLTGPLLIMPAVFLLLHLWRFVWVLRHALNLSWSMALRSMYSFFSLGWVVALACFQGLTQEEGVFLRTPKSGSRSSLLRALRVTQWEAGIGAVCALTGLLAVAVDPRATVLLLGALLVWQASLYLSAPIFSVLSVRASAGRKDADYRGTAVWEHWAARWALGLAVLLLIGAAAIQFLPQPGVSPQYARYQPPDVPPERLLGLERVPIEERAFTPTPPPTATPAPTETPPPATDEATDVTTTPVTATATITATGTITATATGTATPTATATDTATETATPAATATVTDSETAPGSATPTPSATSTEAATPEGAATGTPPATPTPVPTANATATAAPDAAGGGAILAAWQPPTSRRLAPSGSLRPRTLASLPVDASPDALAYAAARPDDGLDVASETVIIRVNQVGYRPDARKVAIAASTGPLDGSFVVERLSDGRAVFSGTIGEDRGAWGTFAHHVPLDFSPLTVPGVYRLRLPAGAVSPAFAIGHGVYDHLAALSLRFFAVQRSGNTDPLGHEPSHLNDAPHSSDPARQLAVTGGWYDAGDYLKFTGTNAYAALLQLLAYRDAPHAFQEVDDDGFPLILYEAGVGLTWLARMWRPQESSLYVQVGSEADHTQPWVLPETDPLDGTALRPVYPPAPGKGANLAGRTAAAFAVAAQVYGDAASDVYAPGRGNFYRTLAEAVYQWGQARPQSQSTFPAHFYDEATWQDDMALAAAELYRLTGGEAYRQDAWAYAQAIRPGYWFSWNVVNSLAHVELARADPTYAPLATGFLEEELAAWQAAAGAIPWRMVGGNNLV